MASLEQKREAFRKYLESAGAIDCLSKALIKLYQEDQKPENACKFIRQTLCENCPTDEEVEASMAELDEARVRIKALEREVRGFQLNKRKSASEVDLALEAGFESLTEDEQCNSLLKKHLTREVLDELKGKKTELKSTLLDCIQSGVKNHDSHVGLYAADPGAYEVFAELFDAVIDEYHGGFAKDSQHPALEWGDVSALDNPDPEGQYIRSTRVRCARSIEGFPFNPRLTEDQYEELYGRVKTVLEGLPEELSGVIQPLETMDKDTQQELTEGHLLFKEGDRFLEAAQSNRFWPVGRAIFLNESKTFVVWVNEEDHLRIISMEQGGDLGNVYKRLITAIELMSKDIAFVRHERLGYLTFCPSNLGTTIRASVHITLPKLSANKEKLDELVAEHQLQIRGTHGEHTESEAGVFDVSNKRRLGLTEFDALKEMNDGIKALIAMEKELEGNGGGEEAPAAEPEPAAEE